MLKRFFTFVKNLFREEPCVDGKEHEYMVEIINDMIYSYHKCGKCKFSQIIL